MNDIINWVALNNTLMIRIGFSAVVLLLVVYAFRFFFMPSASVVPSEASTKDKETGDMHIEELAELQGEIDTLKAKLKEIQNSEQKAPAVNAAPVAPSDAGLETVSVAPAATVSAEASGNVEAANELKEKLKSLEARLAEYEIIAEEIAEIGKLRLENQKLKEMLTARPAVSNVAEVAETPATEAVVEEAAVNDSEIDALLGAVDEKTTADGMNPLAAEDADAGPELGGVNVDTDESLKVSGAVEAEPEKELFIIHSEVEVTEEEKELINNFEQFKKV